MGFHKVVIIGGGFAGLAAARTLLKNGVQDILLIEAKNRLGGRVHTISHGEGPLELGAQWIHGEKGNDIADLAKQIGCLYQFKDGKVKKEWPGYNEDDEENENDENMNAPKTSGFYLSNSTSIPKKLVEEVFKKFDKYMEEAGEYEGDEDEDVEEEEEDNVVYNTDILSQDIKGMNVGENFNQIDQFSVENDHQKGISVGQFLEDKLKKYLNKDKNVNRKALKRALIDWRYLAENTENSCSSIFGIPLSVWWEYYLCPGDEGVELGSKGYQALIDYFEKDLPKNCVKLNSTVSSIEWLGWNEDENDDDDDDDDVPNTTGNSSNNKNSEKLDCCNKPVNENSRYLKMMNQVDDNFFNRIKNNVEKKKININKLKVHLSSGDTIETDHIINTLPLGVLKHVCGLKNDQVKDVDENDSNESTNKIKFFKPSLPSNYLRAIANLPYGTVDKVFFQFESPFWDPDNAVGIQFVWRRGEVVQLDCLKKYGRSYENTKWYQSIQGFNTLLQHRNILCGWVSGPAAIEMERESENLVVDVCLELLEKFSGQKVEKPIKIIRTQWHQDPYSRGVYSYRDYNSSYEDSLQLARALPNDKNPHFLLAGEATHCHFYSTTHGAMITGIEQAQKIIKFYS